MLYQNLKCLYICGFFFFFNHTTVPKVGKSGEIVFSLFLDSEEKEKILCNVNNYCVDLIVETIIKVVCDTWQPKF